MTMLFSKVIRSSKIGLFTATAFAIGSMIGGGVFILTGIALRQTGPSALLSFVMAGTIALLSAISLSIISYSAEHKSSGYTMIDEALGPIWGFLTSWCFYLNAIIVSAFVLNAFGVYMQEFVFPRLDHMGWGLVAALVLVLVNMGPASSIGRIESLLVVGKLSILFLLIIFGLGHMHSSLFIPFTPRGLSPIFATSATLFIAFLGFNVITNISKEIDNPRKNVPRAILLSMTVVTIVYIGVTISMLAAHIGDYSETSVGLAAQKLVGPIGGGLVIFGALIATLSAANANILGSSEIMVNLAGKKQVPTFLGRMYHGHPYASVLFGAVLYVGLLLIGRVGFIVDLANVTAIVALIIINIAAISVLRRDRKFSFILLIPVLGIGGISLQFYYFSYLSLLVSFGLIACGLLVYAHRERYFSTHHHRKIKQAIEAGDTPLGRSLKGHF